MPTNPTHQKTQTTPKLRFPGFSDGWEEKKIGNILKIGSGRDYKHLKKGNIPVYGTGGYMISVDEFLYDGESVCIGRKGTINKPRIIDGKFWTVDTLFYTHSFISSIPKFVYLLFQNINWIKYNEASGVPSLSKATIEKIKLNLPQLPEQNKIATFLTTVDEKIEKIREKKKILEEYKKGVMQKIFSQEVRFPGFRGTREEKKLGEVCEKKSSNISANTLENNNGNYRIYGAAGILKYVDFYEEESDYLAIVKDGAGVGRMLFCKKYSSVLGTLDKIKTKKGTNLYFLLTLLQKINFKKYTVGSTIPHIYFRDYSKEKIMIPLLPEQQKISDFLSAIDEKIEKVGEELEKVVEWKKGLLQGLFV